MYVPKDRVRFYLLDLCTACVHGGTLSLVGFRAVLPFLLMVNSKKIVKQRLFSMNARRVLEI